jgi:thioredoxin 2
VPVCGACKSPRPWIVEADEKSFAAEVAGAPLVLVDFGAEWCGPCRLVAPVLEELAREHAGTLKVPKVNTDQRPRDWPPSPGDVHPHPDALPEGTHVPTWVGLQPKRVPEERLKPYLG